MLSEELKKPMDMHESASYHETDRRAKPSGNQGMIRKIVPEEEQEPYGT